MVTENDIEIASEEYQEFLNSLFQSYGIEGETQEEKVLQLQAQGVSPASLYQMLLGKKEREENLLTPLGLPKEMMVNGQVVNTYKWLLANTDFVPYVAGDSRNIIDNIKTEKRLKTFQQELQDAGYLKQGTYSKGIVGESTLDAVDRLLRDSNNAGQTWNSMIVDVLTNPQYDISDFPTEPELDYNELGNTVVASAQRQIGRDLTTNEYELLLGVLAGFKKEELDDTVKQLTEPAYKKAEIMFEGRPTGVFEGEIEKNVISGSTIRNAESRFNDYIKKQFKPEMDLNQRREQTRNVANVIKSSVAGLRSIGG